MKVCPFCFADVPLNAANCPRCRADLVRYLPADTVAGEPPRSRGLQRIVMIVAAAFIMAAALGVYYPLVSRPAAPAYHDVGIARGAHLVVVPASEAAHDADLWWIANEIRGSAPRVHVMFWTMGSGPKTAAVTDADERRMVADIQVDVARGIHRLARH